MPYCPNAKKATVDYSFTNKKGRFISDKTPIEVIETHEGANFTGGQCPEWYGFIIDGNSTVSRGVGVKGAISSVSIQLVDRYGNPNDSFNFAWYLYASGTGGDDMEVVNVDNNGVGIYRTFIVYQIYSPSSPQFNGLQRYNPSGGDISLEDNCGDPPLGKCTIEILHNQQSLFSVSGDSPCNFTVVCDDECPPGTLKCFSTNYPGYCCLPCEPPRQELQAIRYSVQKLNKGAVSRG